MAFSVIAFIVLIVHSKIGYNKFANYLSPMSWSEIASNLNGYLVVSFLAGGLAYIWPVRR